MPIVVISVVCHGNIARSQILHHLQGRVPDEAVYLFYEFIGEGSKDFVDTYDSAKGAQDAGRFEKCFDELERIARLVIRRIAQNSAQ